MSEVSRSHPTRAWRCGNGIANSSAVGRKVFTAAAVADLVLDRDDLIATSAATPCTPSAARPIRPSPIRVGGKTLHMRTRGDMRTQGDSTHHRRVCSSRLSCTHTRIPYTHTTRKPLRGWHQR
jgi:hypothetical protein